MQSLEFIQSFRTIFRYFYFDNIFEFLFPIFSNFAGGLVKLSNVPHILRANTARQSWCQSSPHDYPTKRVVHLVLVLPKMHLKLLESLASRSSLLSTSTRGLFVGFCNLTSIVAMFTQTLYSFQVNLERHFDANVKTILDWLNYLLQISTLSFRFNAIFREMFMKKIH